MILNETENANVTFAVGVLKEPDLRLFNILPLVIALMALFGNSLIVAAYFKYRNLRDSTTSFIINLGFTDMLTGFVMLTVIVINSIRIPSFEYLICLSLYRIPTYLTIVSQSLILVTTFERYMGICQRENYSKIMTTRVRIALIISAWLLPLPLSLAPFFGYNYWEEVGCNFPNVLPKWLLLSRAFLMFFQTAIVVVVYSRILIKARQIHLQIRPAPIQCINAFTARSKSIRRSIRNGKITGLVTMIFFVTWLPYLIVLLCYCLGDVEFGRGLPYTTKLLGLSNCIVNPFLYAWQRNDIRNRLKQMLRCDFNVYVGSQGSLNGEIESKYENGLVKRNVRVFSRRTEIQQLSILEIQRKGNRLSENTNFTRSKSDLVEVIEL